MKKITFLFALLCASVMGFAIDWSGYDWIGNGSGNAAYTDKFKMTLAEGQALVNIQSPGFATAPGIYTTFPAGIISCSLPASAYDVQGAGMILHVDAFTAQETEVTVVHGTGTAVFTVYYADGTTGGGGGDPDPGTGGGDDPEPAGINWNDYSWIGNGSGNAAYTDKFKMTLATGQAVVNIQQPGFATAPGIYTTLPAGIISCSLPASAYDVQGAGMILHVDAFTAQETEITVVHGTGTAVFTVYYADGTTGGGGDPEPTEIYDVNFALQSQGGVASAKSGNAAGEANDGNIGSRWWSSTDAPMTDAEKNDQWWQVDLGQRRIFNTIQIVWEGAWGKSFDIQISDDGSAWTTVKEIRDQTIGGPFPYTQTIELDVNKTAQYVRFQGIERGTGYAYSFWEFRVLLAGTPVLTSIELTSPATIAQTDGAGVALNVQPKDQNGQNMEAELSWEITPAAAGHMSGSTYIPDQAGNATIRAYSGEIYSPAVSIIGVASANLALSTNISTDNKIIAQSDFTPNGTDAFHAVDGNMGSVWQGSPTNGNVDDSREYDCWFVVDLGAFYNIDLVALHFEGACSELYHIDFSANNTDWNLGYNLVGAGGINARNDYWTELDNNTKVRYVRFWSTKAATEWGMKLFEFEVYGTEWSSGDEEKPVMVSASLVSSTINSAVIAVSATDNDEVARYHVVDNVNGIDANFTPSDGKITIAGLTHATDYNFTITAKDASNNESENSIVVPVSTPFDGTIDLALNKTAEAGCSLDEANDASKANDGLNTLWQTGDNADYANQWWYVDLGNTYNIDRITIRFENARSNHFFLQGRTSAPNADQKADDEAWNTLYEVTSEPQGDYALNEYNIAGKVARYVRFKSLSNTYNNQWGCKIRELCVYGSGVAEVDTEAPVMSSASLVSAADNHAIIAVAATDNVGVAKFHVVDAGNSFDANFVAEGGNITVTGLTGGTAYNLVITAIDFFGNESENSKSVSVNTTAHYTQPQAACPAPTWDASLVKAFYSPTYEATCGFDAWGSGSVFADDTYGKKCTVGNKYFGMVGFTLNCLMMQKVHFDIWVADDMTIRFVPIWGGDEQGITKSLTGQEWNSIDIDLADYTGVTNWGNIYQFKLDQMQTNFNLWIANAYFYREAPYVDTEAPTNVSASEVAEGFYSVKISARAEDNSGAVNFKVMNGEEVLATGAAATGVATTINVNGLTMGTAYNFNVIAYDEAGNEAEPVAVSATTKVLPASAPINLTGKQVVPVYTDATTCDVTGIQTGGWGEATNAQWIEIAPGDNVFYVQNFNYAGWHSWGGGNVDARGMNYLHVDIYSMGATQMSVTPISAGHEGVANITLTPNAWTSADVPLSAYAANNIDWENIFQFKFMNPVGGDELIIDNVYFWKGLVRDDDWMAPGELGTICIPNGAVAEGGDIYQLVGRNEAGKIVFSAVDNNQMAPGVPYLFEAKSNAMKFYYTADEPALAPVNTGAMKGTFDEITITGADLADVYYFAGRALWSCVDLSESGLHVSANRAWVKMDEVEDITTPSSAPGRRYIIMGVNGENQTQGFENLESGDAPKKVMIEGTLYILLGEKVYDATGRLVK